MSATQPADAWRCKCGAIVSGMEPRCPFCKHKWPDGTKR